MAGQTITNHGTGGSALNAQSGSTSGADSNDPRWLEYDSTVGAYVYLPGALGNYLSVPDAASLDITGDLDVRVLAAMDVWASGSTGTLMSKFNTTGNQRSWLFMLTASGLLRLIWSTDGAAQTTIDSTAAISAADGALLWTRVTVDVNNGAGGYDVKFYTSTDAVTWTQLGTTVTTAGATSFYSSSAAVEVGSYNVGTGNPISAGKIHRAEMRNGIDGTLVLGVDAGVLASGGATSFTASTGQTVTINRATSGRKSVAVIASVWLLGTDDYLVVADDALLDFSAAESLTVVSITRHWATGDVQDAIVTKWSGNVVDAGYQLRVDTGQEAVGFTGQGSSIWGQSTATSATQYGAVHCAALVVDRAAQTRVVSIDGVASAPVSMSGVGSLVSSSDLRVGRYGSTTFYTDCELLAVAVFRRALSAAEISSIRSYYNDRWP
jgi:hypothetical protein